MAVGNIIPDNEIKHTAVTESISELSIDRDMRHVLAWESSAMLMYFGGHKWWMNNITIILSIINITMTISNK